MKLKCHDLYMILYNFNKIIVIYTYCYTVCIIVYVIRIVIFFRKIVCKIMKEALVSPCYALQTSENYYPLLLYIEIHVCLLIVVMIVGEDW